MKGRKSSGDIEHSGTYPTREGRTILSSFREWGDCPIVTFSSLERLDSVGQGPFVRDLENSDWSPSNLHDLLGPHEWNERVELNQCFLTFFIMKTPFKQQQKIETAPSPSPSTTHVNSGYNCHSVYEFSGPSRSICISFMEILYIWEKYIYRQAILQCRVVGCLVCFWNYRPLAHVHRFLMDLDWEALNWLSSSQICTSCVALSQDKIPGLVSLFLSANWRSFVEEILCRDHISVCISKRFSKLCQTSLKWMGMNKDVFVHFSLVLSNTFI